MVQVRRGQRKLQKLVPNPKWKWNFSKEFKELMKKMDQRVQAEILWSVMIQDRD